MFVLVQIPCGVGGGWALCEAVVFYFQVSAHFSFSDDAVQCCRLSFWRCLFVLRVDFVHFSVGDTDGVVARISCLGLSGCDELLVPDLSFVVVFDSRF